MFHSVDPRTAERFASYPVMDTEQVSGIIDHAGTAFLKYRRTSITDRRGWLNRTASLLREKKEFLAELMAHEMGKPRPQGVAEIEKCAWVCEYYAANGDNFLKAEEVRTDASKSYIAYQPLGTILAIMPWNFPFWQVFRFAAPALMAGNCGILKHSPNVCGCALEIEKLIEDAGFPENVFKTVIIDVTDVEAMIRDDRIAAVTLTGSTRAGRSVAAIAGSEIKKCVLELGGSDPYIVTDSANIEQAAKSCITGRFLNAGQSCIAAKRLLVFEKVYEEFKAEFLKLASDLKVGDPLEEGTFIGPMARQDLRDSLHEQVVRSVTQGAQVLMGGYIPDGPGFFYPVTVVEEPATTSPVCTEEVFGPVAVLVKVRDMQHALEIANSTRYGLGAAVFTGDISFGESVALNELEAGSCFVNTFVKSDPRLPFGGIKTSGFGRELSLQGIREFVNVKSVYVA